VAVKREQVVQTAEKYVSRGRIEPAIREYRKLLEENPNDINTLNRVGDLYARIQRIDEAVDFFNQIAEQYAAEGFFVKAIAIYKKIIKLDPTRLDVYESLAELYHRQGLVTEARTQYQVLADYYQKHENATSAIAIYQKMAQLEPANPTYHVKLAELYQQQKLSEKAIGEYRIIAELMLEHGHIQEAAQVYERALSIDSESIPFITDAALKLKQAGGNAVASRFLAAAIDRNPLAERVVRLVGVAEDSAHAALAAAFGAPQAAPASSPASPASLTSPASPPSPTAPGFEPEESEEPAPAPGAAAPPTGREPEERGAPATAAAVAEARAAAPAEEPSDDDHVPFFDAPALPEGEAPAEHAVAAGGERGEISLEDEIELDLEMDLDLVDPSSSELARAQLAGPAVEEEQEAAFEVEDEAAAPAGSAPAAPRAAAPVPDEDVFVLDMEDDAEPSSLVKPPPDMLEAPHRPAWSQESRGGVVGQPTTASTPPPSAPRTAPRAPAPPAGAPVPPSAYPAAAPAGQDTVDLGHLDLVDPLAGIELENPFAVPALAPEAPGAPPTRPAPGPAGPVPAVPAVPAGAGPAAGTPAAGAAAAARASTAPATGAPASTAPGAAFPGAALPGAAAPAAATTAAGAKPAIRIDSELLERTAAEIQPQASEREEDLVSEAEVLAKYGLQDKAMERLRDALRLRPNHLGAYALLIHLQLEKGRHARVAELAQQMWRAATATGDRDLWPKMRKRLLAAGYRLDGEHVLPPPDLAAGAVAEQLGAERQASSKPPATLAPGLAADLAARLAKATGTVLAVPPAGAAAVAGGAAPLTAAPGLPPGSGSPAGRAADTVPSAASSGAADAAPAPPQRAGRSSGVRKRQTARTRVDQILAGLMATPAAAAGPGSAAEAARQPPPAAAPGAGAPGAGAPADQAGPSAPSLAAAPSAPVASPAGPPAAEAHRPSPAAPPSAVRAPGAPKLPGEAPAAQPPGVPPGAGQPAAAPPAAGPSPAASEPSREAPAAPLAGQPGAAPPVAGQSAAAPSPAGQAPAAAPPDAGQTSAAQPPAPAAVSAASAAAPTGAPLLPFPVPPAGAPSAPAEAAPASLPLAFPASAEALSGSSPPAPALTHPTAGATADQAPGPPPPLPPPAEDEAQVPIQFPPPAAPASPPGRTSGVFNPLEIGAMVENEEIDWDHTGTAGAAGLTAAQPRSASAGSPPVFLPAPSAGGGPAAGSGRGSSPASLDDTGMSWLDEADTGKKKAARASSFFDDEDEFFDLAGELEQELSKEAAFQAGDLLVQPAEQSLEEIVEGFKRGVAEHLSPTDYDTHFNLGIAYREMGLLDEAIGEFQLAAKDSRYLVQCCSMLGLCFLDKGLPELAIKWYRRGLEAPGLSEEDTLGLLYDQGCVYVQMGDADSAYKTFVEVYGINSNYRDIVARIEELGNPH
jgi:tetratricopeptide (TPR) repeat protein